MASILDLIAGGGGLFSDRWSPVPQALNSGMFDVGPSPFALALGGSQRVNDSPAYSALFAPAPQAIPQNASLAGPQPMPPQAPQAGGNMPSALGGLPIPFGGAMGSGQGGGFLDNLNRALSNNSNMLIGLGGDIMSGGFRTRGLSGAMGGGALDQRQAEERQARATQVSSQMAIYSALIQKGASPAEAAAAASNPTMAKAILDQLYPAEKFHKVGPGETLFATSGGGMKPVVSGGPEKPPAGYQYADPKDPSKGLSPIAGGPATHIPAETAGRVALMDTALRDFGTARKELERPWNKGDRLMALVGAGEIGKAQRIVRAGIEASLRAMTGAAAPETEVSRYMDLFMPGQTDLPSTAKQKLDLLEDFMRNAKKTITQGRTPAPADPLGLR